jgi:hypothetical protein
MDFVVAAVQVPRALAAAALGLGLFSAFFNVREEKETVWEEQFGTTHPAHALRPFPPQPPQILTRATALAAKAPFVGKLLTIR